MIFEYRARDRQGQARTGRLQAVSRQAALQRFHGERWIVEWLREVPESPSASPAIKLATPPGPTRPAPRGDGRRLWSPSDSLVRALSWISILLGLLWLAGSQLHRSQAAPSARPQTRTLVVQGQLSRPIGRLRLIITDLPLALERPVSQVADSSGHFRFELELSAARIPRSCQVVQIDESGAQRVSGPFPLSSGERPVCDAGRLP